MKKGAFPAVFPTGGVSNQTTCPHLDNHRQQLDNPRDFPTPLIDARPPIKNISRISTDPMATQIVLASSSTIRLQLLEAAGLPVQAAAARIDEDMIRDSLVQDMATPRDIADALAEMKAIRVAERYPEAVTIGCDQVLEFQGKVWAKPDTLQQAQDQLCLLRGKTHRLLSAVVVCHGEQSVWRHVGTARLTMRDFSDNYLAAYLARNWPDVGQSVGAYKLEQEGIRLFSDIEGDHFTILGLPLLPLLSYLTLRGFIDS